MMMARFYTPCHELGLTPRTRELLKQREKREKEEIKDAVPHYEKKAGNDE